MKNTVTTLAAGILLALSATAAVADSLPTAFSYKDVFELEYAAAPVFTPDSKQIIYERRSNDRDA